MSGLRSISNVAGLIIIAQQVCSSGHDSDWIRDVLDLGLPEWRITREILDDLNILRSRTEYIWIGLDRKEEEIWEWHPDFYQKNS